MYFKTVLKYIRRSPYQAMAAVMIMTLTFFTVSVFFFLSFFSLRLVGYFESKPQLTVFFKDNTPQENIESMINDFNLTGKVSSIHFVSKEEALEIYKEQNKDSPILLDLVTADILPASIEVQARKAEHLSDLTELVKNSSDVEEIVFQKDVVDTLISWVSAFKKIGIVIVSVLSLVSIFVIVTIIGIKITIRRDEIEIMKLIGATNWFIRMPFIIEGMLYGIVGVVMGGILCFLLILYARPFLESFLRGIPIFPLSYPLLLAAFGIEFLSALFLGGFASFLAVLRYLK